MKLISFICFNQIYKKPYFDENAYQSIYSKSRKTFNIRQLAALKSLYHWRDRIARQEDESTGYEKQSKTIQSFLILCFRYVLPNHMLLQIAEILPRFV